MRDHLTLSLSLLLLLGAATAGSVSALVPAFSASAGDPMVEKAVGRIAEVEAAEKALAAGDKKKAELLLNQLGWATKRLNAVVQQSTPEWKAAMKRHNEVLKKLETKRDAKPAPAPSSPPATPPATPPTGGNGTGTPPKPAPPKPAPPKPAPSTGKVYDHEKVVRLHEDVNRAFENAKAIPIKFFLDANRVNGMKKEIAGFRERLAAFPESHENVQVVQGNIDLYENSVNGVLEKIAADRAAEPVVTQKLDGLMDKYSDENFPTRIEPPYSETQIRAWATELHLRRTKKIPEDLAWLQSVEGNLAVKPGRVASLANALTGTETRKINESERYVVDGLDGFAADGVRVAEDLLQIDPGDENKMQQHVLGEGQLARNMEMLATMRHRAEMARILDKTLERENPPSRDAQVQKMDLAKGHLEELAKIGLAEMRMPKAASTSEELRNAAEETLKKKDYEVGEWTRLVISGDLREHKKREGWIDFDTVTTSVTFYDYEWKEFFVTTAEPIGDETWLFFNRLRFYTSGDSTTPLNRWILADRIKTTPILPENLDK
ncbi:hypothetical protein Poly30_49220 [Planctomycetes bacterium Poly30]|uniref:Uncharacterized protein n=1 Tax=Saltatorellus ferox TaxID=2528018 RepID=A0A518EZ60_9BACT|nr:hypothetical protein Poly30_49220 [Planctomycetes bacterium Poly30]